MHIAKACAGKEVRAAFRQVVTYIHFGKRPVFLLQANCEIEWSAWLLTFPFRGRQNYKKDKTKERKQKVVDENISDYY